MYNNFMSQPSKIKNSLSLFFYFFENLLHESVKMKINSLPSIFW